MAKYAFPAVFTKEKTGGFSVVFPDIQGCYTQGETMEEALSMANDVLCMNLYDFEKEQQTIPTPSEHEKIKTNKNEFVQFISCDTDWYRKFYEKKAVKKTLSIPSYLNARAELAGINFSALLQEALKQKLSCGN